jgi:hypothetical protein
MELLFVLRALGRHKLLVLVGVLAAAGAGFMAYKSKPPVTSTVAWTRVIVDAPKSTLVDAESEAADSLPWRSELIAANMTSEPMRAELAKRMGLPADQVDVINPTLVNAPIPASVPEAAARAAAITPAPYVLTPSVPNAAIPMISLEAAAPDVAGAKKLVAAAVEELQAHAVKPGRYTSLIYTGAGKDELEPFEVDQIAPVQSNVTVTSEAPMMGVAAAMFVLLGWCSVIVILPALLAALRRRAEAEPSPARS